MHLRRAQLQLPAAPVQSDSRGVAQWLAVLDSRTGTLSPPADASIGHSGTATPRGHLPCPTTSKPGEPTPVAVKIKLKRLGKIRSPHYRIVVADSRTRRDGRAIEEIGLYHPVQNPSRMEVDADRVAYWLSVGAQPTEPVLAILKKTGDWQKFKGEPARLRCSSLLRSPRVRCSRLSAATTRVRVRRSPRRRRLRRRTRLLPSPSPPRPEHHARRGA